jgi:uracil-DNA glycosylase family 4
MRKLESEVGAGKFLPAGRSIQELRAAAANCKGCELWRNATQTVFGGGSEHAKMMLIGEQPGDQEDLTGIPFSGPAGQLLDRGLVDAGIDRQQVYITNAVKHFK